MFARLQPGSEAEFQALLSIYTASIPTSERKNESALRAMLQRADYTFLIARQRSAVAGFAIVVSLDEDAALLEYLAVDPEQRGAGVGSQLFAQSLAAIHPRTLLIEVESPDGAVANQDIVRRIVFYRRSGCRRISGLAYRMPRVSDVEPSPMHLYVHSGRLPLNLENSRLRTWLETIYRNVYGRSSDDPAIDAMLFGLPNQIPLL